MPYIGKSPEFGVRQRYYFTQSGAGATSISGTDWWASSDLTMTDAQKTYRQALRDITKSATSLDDVTWPNKP